MNGERSLVVDAVTVRFGGVHALEDVSFEAHRGEIVGLIGPNGAGKTTLFNVISGIQRPTAGRVRLQDVDLTDLPVHRIAALGVTRTFQTPVMFFGLTVRDSLLVALAACTMRIEGKMLRAGFGIASRREEAALREQADALLAGTPLASCADRETEFLSFGQERMLEILRSLAIRPSVLLLDEPLSGLNPDEAAHALDLVRTARTAGTTVLFVEHDLSHLVATVDRFVVLDHGRKIAEGTPEMICADPIVIEAYIGDEVA